MTATAQTNGAVPLTAHASAGYQPSRMIAIPWGNLDRPVFTLAQVELMMLDADIFLGMEFLRGPIAASEWEVVADDPEVQAYVDASLRRIFDTSLEVIQGRGEAFGHVGGEVLIECGADDGRLHFAGFQEFGLGDAQPLMRGAEVGGVRVTAGLPEKLDLPNPKGAWFHFGPSARDVFGRSRFIAAHQPWLDDNCVNGLQDSIRLWFTMNMFSGAILLYPDGMTDEAAPGEAPRLRSNAQIAWDIIAKARNGFVMALPNQMDANGKPLWQWIKPEGHAAPDKILEREEGLRKKKWRGLGIADEVLQANATGSGYAGRSVPADGFLSGRESVRGKIWSAIDRQILRPLVGLNFGGARSTKYRVEFVPLRKSGQPPKEQAQAATAADKLNQVADSPGGAPPQLSLFSASPLDTGRPARQSAAAFTDDIIKRSAKAAGATADRLRKELL